MLSPSNTASNLSNCSRVFYTDHSQSLSTFQSHSEWVMHASISASRCVFFTVQVLRVVIRIRTKTTMARRYWRPRLLLNLHLKRLLNQVSLLHNHNCHLLNDRDDFFLLVSNNSSINPIGDRDEKPTKSKQKKSTKERSRSSSSSSSRDHKSSKHHHKTQHRHRRRRRHSSSSSSSSRSSPSHSHKRKKSSHSHEHNQSKTYDRHERKH